MKNVDRRSFIGGSLAASAAGIASVASANTEEAGELLLDASNVNAKWAFEIPPAPITDIAEEFTADLVVVGAGTAGLVTANSAVEEGLKVILVSASEKPVSRGGSNNAIYCKALEREGYPRMDSWEVEREAYFGSHKIDQKKWYKNYNNNETAINWACDIMEEAGYAVKIEFGGPLDNPLFHQSSNAVGWDWGSVEPDPSIPTITGMMQPLLVNRLADRLVEMGGQIFYKHIGRQLVRGGVPNGTSGRVDAVICEREDGTYAKFTGVKAVVLATGDFSANRDMMARYAPDWADVISDETYDGETWYDIPYAYGGLYKGEGHLMGLWCGAAWQRIFPNCAMVWSQVPGPNYLYGGHVNLVLDKYGERFMNEYVMWQHATNNLRMLPDQSAFAIWDSNYAAVENIDFGDALVDFVVDDPVARAKQAIVDWDALVEAGTYVKGDTLEEVIEQLGLPLEATMATIKRYNEFAHAGLDADFHKNPEHLHPIEVGPFYGGANRGTYDFLTILGGLRTNANMQVCAEDDTPIEGLYNVGTMVGDMFNSLYTFQIEGANYGMCCITFGYLTGKYIAQNE